MGLGKTYQVLAFLKWLRDGRAEARRRPLLVVAPKTLIGNWIEELERHLGADALGPLLRVQDQGLRALRRVKQGNDTLLGQATLDLASLAQAGLVLTSYETLRDYQLSFAQLQFAVIVYDEAQRLKNPAAMVTRAAKGQQGDFTLLMTGTPIENGVLDLWTLLDVAWPGFLGLSAREFLKHYRRGPMQRPGLSDRTGAPGNHLSAPSDPPGARRWLLRCPAARFAPRETGTKPGDCRTDPVQRAGLPRALPAKPCGSHTNVRRWR
jgi:SNF2 family DNA or RNA helicase